jgi:NAD(P)-dependent dehydrogenase (short-subunit alcohol dehydrogenase family)
MTTLEGQTILIVGGSTGIGYSVAKFSLLSKASRVVIVSSNKDKVDKAVSRLIADMEKDVSGAKDKVSGDVVDAKIGAQIRALMERVGEIDHLVWTSGDTLTGVEFPQADIDDCRGMLVYSLILIYAQAFRG